MKKLLLLWMVLVCTITFGQNDIDQILEIGIENAQRFSQDYFDAPGESLINNMSNGWYNTAKVKKLWDFEVGFVGNLSFVREEKKNFILDVNDYQDLSFSSGVTRVYVNNGFGMNTEGISVIINEGQASQTEVVLPDGFSGQEINSVPGGFIQASIGLIHSTEIKLRFFPKYEIRENTKVQIYGVAFQHEITDWFFPTKRWPVRIASLLGYTNVKGFYDLTTASGVPGSEQEITLNSNSWLLASIVSTKMKTLNFYGGIGYYFGSNEANLLGTYQIQNGPFASTVVTDPIRVTGKAKGLKANIGARVAYGVFKANLDYSLQNYKNLSLGLQIGW
ncbi:DUF6588 family protein [Aquimarina brevivitae]|uniref:Uncharacterized protein n=1 Tax=Aquimarina brevivitae TaxID=323412 RepID=A0A4Q7NXF4_9FLAO|nr:DUF6588 family protein [Aquimarina brevivitae]RZS91914.1 hypothetical protein EV197_3018 [Aquimarina brevivitae]